MRPVISKQYLDIQELKSNLYNIITTSSTSTVSILTVATTHNVYIVIGFKSLERCVRRC
jgi:hypothetical protein